MTRTHLALAAVLMLSCSGSNNSSNANNVDWTKGRGDAACHEWQQAYCEYIVRCAGTSRSDCANQTQGIVCSSDTTAADCATSLSSASCSSLPSGCDAKTIADATAAVTGCNGYLTAICDLDAQCTTTTKDACMSQAQAALDCTKTIGLALSFDDCMKKLNAATCSTPEPPSECTNSIILAK